MMFTKFVLVISSLNSKSTCSAALAIALSRTKNNLRTLILSNALGDVKVFYWVEPNDSK